MPRPSPRSEATGSRTRLTHPALQGTASAEGSSVNPLKGVALAAPFSFRLLPSPCYTSNPGFLLRRNVDRMKPDPASGSGPGPAVGRPWRRDAVHSPRGPKPALISQSPRSSAPSQRPKHMDRRPDRNEGDRARVVCSRSHCRIKFLPASRLPGIERPALRMRSATRPGGCSLASRRGRLQNQQQCRPERQTQGEAEVDDDACWIHDLNLLSFRRGRAARQ